VNSISSYNRLSNKWCLPQVFSGITMTKLIGISVLALTRSKLLEVSRSLSNLESTFN
jgi:hypothetical protein